MNEAQAVFISAIANGVTHAGRERPSRGKWKDSQTIALIGWHSTQNNCKCAHNGDTKATPMQNFTWKISLSRSQRCSNVIRVSHVGRRQWWRRRTETCTGYISKAFIGHTMWPPPWHYWFVWVWLCACVWMFVLVSRKKTSSSFVVVIVDDVLGFRCPLDRSKCEKSDQIWKCNICVQ